MHPALPAVEAVICCAESPDLCRAVGLREVQGLAEHARLAACALRSDDTPSAVDTSNRLGDGFGTPQAKAVFDVVGRCLGLAAAVDRDFDDGTRGHEHFHCSTDGSTSDWDWDFGGAVSLAIGNGLAAAAEALPLVRDSTISLELLEELSRDLDCLAVHLFGGLARLGAQRLTDKNEAQLQRSLQIICAWALAALGRTLGYERFSPGVLWEWAASDPLWALVLAKGVLSLSPKSCREETVPGDVLLPTEIRQLQEAALGAVLGLAAPSVAFAAEVSGEVMEDDTCNTIALRSAWLAQHRSKLARAVVDCRILEVLIDVSRHVGAAVGLASFLIALVQPDLAKDPDWSLASFEAVDAIVEARQNSFALQRQLNTHTQTLWNAFAEAPTTSSDVTSWSPFVRDCADLVRFVPAPNSQARTFLGAFLPPGRLADHGSLASLCMWAVSARLAPEGDGALLAEVLVGLDPDARGAVATRWRVAVADATGAAMANPPDLVAHWAAVLEVPAPPVPQTTPAGFADVLAANPAKSTVAPGGSGRGAPGALQELVRLAPAEFRCAQDGQLMMDPVRSPDGHVFERAGLARALENAGGHCPLTGRPLTLDECSRLPELRRRIAHWVRESSDAAGRRRRPVALAAAAAQG